MSVGRFIILPKISAKRLHDDRLQAGKNGDSAQRGIFEFSQNEHDIRIDKQTYSRRLAGFKRSN
jgi:hypothetical protein